MKNTVVPAGVPLLPTAAVQPFRVVTGRIIAT